MGNPIGWEPAGCVDTHNYTLEYYCLVNDDRYQECTDTAPPVIGDQYFGQYGSNVPAPITIEATSSAGATVLYSNPTAYDIKYGPVPVSCNPRSGSTFPIGQTTVNCEASDVEG